MIVYRPYDRVAIRDVSSDEAATVDRKLELARRTFANKSEWLPAYKRIEILRRLAGLVQEEHETFAQSIAEEGGKPLIDARVEVSRAVSGIEIAASSIERMAGEEIPMGLTAASAGRWAFTTKEPIGVVVAISAFNHPLNLIVHQVCPAIATGCPVIVKPAPVTPLTCIRFIELTYQAGLPESWCQVIVLDDNSIAERLATDTRVAFLSFIGSAKVGWQLRSKLAPGTRCALEHGGAAPVVVDRSADLALACELLVKGGYYHAGQVCVSAQRIFIDQEVKGEFVGLFTKRVHDLRVGDPLLELTEVGPLILPREVDRVETWVGEAGGVVCGGARLSATCFQPTILLEPPAKARVSREEVFGPVTCIYGYSDLNEGIQRANDLPFAFQAAVFTRDVNLALESARALDASAVMINDHPAFRADWMPFAGRRQSGYGIGGMLYTMRDMTADKMIVFKF